MQWSAFPSRHCSQVSVGSNQAPGVEKFLLSAHLTASPLVGLCFLAAAKFAMHIGSVALVLAVLLGCTFHTGSAQVCLQPLTACAEPAQTISFTGPGLSSTLLCQVTLARLSCTSLLPSCSHCLGHLQDLPGKQKTHSRAYSHQGIDHRCQWVQTKHLVWKSFH